MRITAKGIDLHDPEALMDLEDEVQRRLGRSAPRTLTRKFNQIWPAEVLCKPPETRESTGMIGKPVPLLET